MTKSKKILIVVSSVVAVIIIVSAMFLLTRQPKAVITTAASHISLAENYLLDLNYEAAIAEYRAAIQIDPKNADYYIALAEVYIEMGDTDAAIGVLEEGLAAVEEADKERIRAVLEGILPEETIVTTTTTTVPTTTTEVTTTTEATITTEATTATEATTIALNGNTDITNLFPDPGFRAKVRDALGIDANDPIMSDDVGQVTDLDVDHFHSDRPRIKDLSGIEYFTSLEILNCNNSSIVTIPKLPDTLTYFTCNYGTITQISELPESLKHFECASNDIVNLPELPNSLEHLDCFDNDIESLPELPATLTYLNCGVNQLTGLPELPDSLIWFTCDRNQLTSLPELPSSLSMVVLDGNPDLNISTIVFKDGSTLLEHECDDGLLIRYD
jgi:FimV-like protein